MKHKILFEPFNIEVEVPVGSNLLRSAIEQGIHINASCGGEGVCGKCRVIIENGRVEGGLSSLLSDEDVEKGYRLACLSEVTEDITVRIPTESSLDAKSLNKVTKRFTAKIREFDLNELKDHGLFIPPIEKKYLELPEPSITDNLSDVSRLVSYLKLTHGEDKIQLSYPVIQKIPDVIREDNFKITATMERPLNENNKSRIVNIEPGDTTDKNYALAIDVGTTTVYGQLVDLTTGNIVAEKGDFNSQISYGEDVINRIVFAEKGDGLEVLQKAIVKTLNGILKYIIKKGKVEADWISTITIAGNTTMTQLLMKINPRFIRRSPYVPAATIYPPLRAMDIGFELPEHVTALLYPQISSYVGGDIVAGVMGSGMYRTDEVTLFLDIGTNAEIVIGNKDWMACAACSAGPAFEGGGVKMGMRATEGAIEDFSIDPITFEPMNITVGNIRPKGICGSGLITIVAKMFENGVIDSAGKFKQEVQTNRIRIDSDNICEYVIAWEKDSSIDRDIVINEIDIENLIRAKGAVYSGCVTLIEEVGLTIENIERVILAGGFGSYIDLEKAMTIGLIPETDPEKVTFIGNGSLMGAKMSSLTNRIRKDVANVTKMMTSFELSETPSYMDHYMASLFLPHTDIEKFPKLKERLEL
ncbi:MAG: DUF4445 domain-containing protein [Desulfobacterales bacterium]|nr:DUF4445 domain-containing protein [Desulfobacterales bacterium]MCP4160152.1 DUF4445 domain-containing protein [Deltaproteobacteria bacterium]